MMYTCIREWRDLTDRHLYKTGDAFPHDGREISPERIAELSGTQNKAGFALIEAVTVPDEEEPIHNDTQPKKAVRGRRKAG